MLRLVHSRQFLKASLLHSSPRSITTPTTFFPPHSILLHKRTTMSSSNLSSKGLPTVLAELPPVFTALYESKTAKKLSFEDLAKQIDRNEWYTAALFYGQAKPDKDDLDKLSKALDIPRENLESSLGEHFFPNRGVGEWPPKG